MPKSITGSVGQGGKNAANDVMTVQYLLNCVPASDGGPSPELAVDGLVGPKTKAAIANFQKAKLGFSDSRVDPMGRTLKALQPFDPSPGIPLMAGAGGAKGAAPGAAKAGSPAPPAKGAGGGEAAGKTGGGAGGGAAAGKASGNFPSKSSGGGAGGGWAGGGWGGGKAGGK